MVEIALFVEDHAHHEVLKAFIGRFAREHGVEIKLDPRNVRRGYGAVIHELKQYLRDLYRGRGNYPDLVVVATDANCGGLNSRLREISEVTQRVPARVVCAVPDPHIERWLLVDSSAFKAVFGRGCTAPDRKCDKSRYKKMLIDGILQTGRTPSLGGIEFAEDIIEAMDLKNAARHDPSLGRFLEQLRTAFEGWHS
jgi:hypothetical protein